MLDRIIVTFCKYNMQFGDENKFKKSIDYVNLEDRDESGMFWIANEGIW